MINPMPTDADVETWFMRYVGDASGTSDHALMPIAAWIPIIGLPANDR